MKIRRGSKCREFRRQLAILLALITLLGAFGLPAMAQDQRDWQSVAQLHPGDRIHLSLKAGPVDGPFQSWAPEEITVGTTTARKDDVLRIERYQQGGSGRGKSAAIGALIGFGAGFGIGAAVGGCKQGQFGPCESRGTVGAVIGAVGAIVGAGIGALLPRHHRELIYRVR